MIDFAKKVAETQVPTDGVALWWLAQAGYVFKAAPGTVIYLDPYLSDAAEHAFGFKRLSLAPVEAEHVCADWVLSTHEHLDHLDTDALPVIARNNPDCRFAGSSACEAEYGKCGIERERQLILVPNETYEISGVTLRTAKADHGDLSPSALAFRLDFGSVGVVFTGDTALRPDLLAPLFEPAPTLLITCINGRFGNMNADEAAQLTALAKPRIALPCHFGMFKEHNGDPEAFVQACAERTAGTRVDVLTPGRGLLLTPASIEPLS